MAPVEGFRWLVPERDDLNFGTWDVDKVCQKHVASLIKLLSAQVLFCSTQVTSPVLQLFCHACPQFRTDYRIGIGSPSGVAPIKAKLSASLIDQQTAHLYHHGLHLCSVCAPESQTQTMPTIIMSTPYS